MNIEKITLPKDEAIYKLEQYKKNLGKMQGKRVAKEVRAAYEAALAGYKVLAKGTPLIDLNEVIVAGGFDHKERPRLAIARSDQTSCKVRRRTNNMCIFLTNLNWAGYQKTVRSNTYSIEVNLGLPALRQVEGFSLVPVVPGQVLSKLRGGNLHDYFTLYEVEQWADNYKDIMPDRDPYLLKHIGGALYAVIDQWDLTDLERSVMSRFLS